MVWKVHEKATHLSLAVQSYTVPRLVHLLPFERKLPLTPTLLHFYNDSRYVMLAASSSFKGKSDREKYSKAMRLKGCIGKIRADYKKNLTSKDSFNRQLATAM